ncbi:protein FAR1-RELATED SEQUENCE 5-like [Silene latifolia]|uniref:protein FAR1-RELATED SEQUENCE 5-like n=1 Tax=Silene latifolia TaxID=37657 RepID=UPI003D77D2D3
MVEEELCLALETVLEDNMCVVDNDDSVVPVVTDDEFVTMMINKGSFFSLFMMSRVFDYCSKRPFLICYFLSQIGFSVKKSTSRRADIKDRPLIERYFRCSCERNHGNKSKGGLNGGVEIFNNNLRNVSITRCECKACVRMQVNEEGLWEVLQHKIEHNHPLTPPEWQHHHRSERKISEAEGELIKAMTEAHVPPSVQFRVGAAAAGGHEFLGHTKRDHINYVNRLRMKKIEGGDAATLVNLLTMSPPELVYPTSRHRLCQCHIQQNAISHFGKLKGDRPFQNLFNKCLNGCYNVPEFEETWRKMLKDYGLEGHSWFKRLYKHRVKWSTALNNEYFSAGILSSQRSESTNHPMGFQASKTTSVTAFFGIFETTVKRWRSEEERKEFNGIRSTPTSVYPLADLLLHASQIYTVDLFGIFEREFALAMGTRATILPVDDPLLVYRVQPVVYEEGPYHVTYNCSDQLIECTCRKFQVMGMFCSHIIRVLHMHSVGEIPSRYILRRWTKFSKTAVWERLLPSDIRRSAANDAIN